MKKIGPSSHPTLFILDEHNLTSHFVAKLKIQNHNSPYSFPYRLFIQYQIEKNLLTMCLNVDYKTDRIEVFLLYLFFFYLDFTIQREFI